jgi:lipid II:glycine glycyltransferase (peptidoglycan interpeptide bridge formation enzyme)
LYELPGGQQLILPMVRRRGLPAAFAWEASLLPGWGMGGLITRQPLEQQDVERVFADLASRSPLHISIRPNPRMGAVWAAAQPDGIVAIPRVAHVLDLDGGFDVVWTKRFTKSTRKRIHKAERSGLVVECDSSGKLVPVFYDLFRRSIDRWAEQQHEPRLLAHWRNERRDSRRKIETIARVLGETCRIWVAWLRGQPVAAVLLLQGKNVNDARSVMDKELAAPVHANDLLLSLAIEEACRAGCRYYHLGESGDSAGLHHYKSRFGAVPYEYAEYHIERWPITRIDRQLRGLVKRLIGFRDVQRSTWEV